LDAIARFNYQNPVSFLFDVVRNVSVALRIQCVDGIAIEHAGGVEAIDRFDRCDGCCPRIRRAYHCVLCVQYARRSSWASFYLLLVVALCTVAGILGLGYLLKMLKRFTLFGEHGSAVDATLNRDDNSQEKTATEMVPPLGLGRPAQSTSYTIFRVWVFVFAVVGAQMSWVLRPFIGSPDLEFSWFRERSGNFFQTVFVMLFKLFSGDY
jgi:hypothetical protein